MAKWLTQFGVFTSTPWAFLGVIIYGSVWWNSGKLEIAGVATLAVWMMTLFIQRAQHRDTQALHAKLDELLRTHGEARSELTKLDAKEPEEIEQFRRQEHERSQSN